MNFDINLFEDPDAYKRFCNVLKKHNLKLEKINKPTNIDYDANRLSRLIIETEAETNTMPCMEKIHPYLNQIDPENETILDNIDDIIDAVITKKQKRPIIRAKNTGPVRNESTNPKPIPETIDSIIPNIYC